MGELLWRVGRLLRRDATEAVRSCLAEGGALAGVELIRAHHDRVMRQNS